MLVVSSRSAGYHVKKVTSFFVHVSRCIKSELPSITDLDILGRESTSGGTGDRIGPGVAASTLAHYFAARKLDGTLQREVKGKKCPFVCTVWAQEPYRAIPSPHLFL